MNPRLLFLILLCAVVFGAAAWLARGIYDRPLDGQFMVVNGMAEERLIRVVFPSGTAIERSLRSGESSTIRIEDRGEGSLRVYADDEPKTPPQGYDHISDQDRAVVLRVNERGISVHNFRTDYDVPGPEVSGWKIVK